MCTNFSIIVPVFEETAALEFSMFYFEKMGVQPIYALDSKRIGRRAKIEKLLGRKIEVYENPGDYIEASYEHLAALSPTDWLLRIDCDELPNHAMLEYCKNFVAWPTDNYCGFDRDDLIWRDHHFERLKYAPLFIDTQFRLFNRAKVLYTSRIHSPGFHVPKWKLPLFPKWHAPRVARIHHLQRVFASPQQRAEKLRRYNAAGQEQQFDDWLARPDESFKWRSFHDDTITNYFTQWKMTQQK